MSRGYGRQERRILAALADAESVWLGYLNQSGSRAEYNALSRAAWRLHDCGLIGLIRYTVGPRRTLITRTGAVITDRPEGWLRSHKRWKGPDSGPVQHLPSALSKCWKPIDSQAIQLLQDESGAVVGEVL